MYRALVFMNIRGQDGHPQDIEAGEEVPGFGEWDPWVKMAMENERRVRWAPEGLTEPELERARLLKPLEFGGEATPTATRPLPGASLEEGILAEPEPDVVPVQAGTERVIAPTEPDALQCDVCGRTGFKNVHGLTIHKKVHK